MPNKKEERIRAFGGLFKAKKRKSNSPDFTGVITLNSDFLDEVFKAFKQHGDKATIQISTWWKEPKGGGEDYLSISAEAGQVKDADDRKDDRRSDDRSRDRGRSDDRDNRRSGAGDDGRRDDRAKSRRPEGRDFDDEIPFATSETVW